MLFLLVLNMGLSRSSLGGIHVECKWKWVPVSLCEHPLQARQKEQLGTPQGKKLKNAIVSWEKQESYLPRLNFRSSAWACIWGSEKTPDRISVTIADNGLAGSPPADGVRVFLLKEHSGTAVSHSDSLLKLQGRWREWQLCLDGKTEPSDWMWGITSGLRCLLVHKDYLQIRSLKQCLLSQCFWVRNPMVAIIDFFFFTLWGSGTQVPNKYTETSSFLWMASLSLTCL